MTSPTPAEGKTASTKHRHAWLHEQLEAWAAAGLISRDQQTALAARYPLPAAGTPWGTIVFASLGAVIAGLGVILLFAYNWDAIPKFAKLGLILGALAATHATGIALAVRSARYRALGEAINMLGSMLFGAGIWLVAQVYHIQEHFPTAFLVWGAGALLMALAMPSVAQAILAAVLLTVWAGTERIGFNTPMILAPVLIAGLLGSLAWARKSRLLLAVVVPAFLLSFAFSTPSDGHHTWLVFSTLLSIAALLIGLSLLSRSHGSFPQAGSVLGFYGWSLYLSLLYLMSFPGLAREVYGWESHDLTARSLACWLIPLVACLAGWAPVVYDRQARQRSRPPGDLGFALYLIPLTVLLSLFAEFHLRELGGWATAGPFNLVFVGLAATMMVQGCRNGWLRPTVLGSVLLVLLMAARYFDLFESLLIRGVIFVGMGALLFVEGIFYSRARRQATGGKPA